MKEAALLAEKKILEIYSKPFDVEIKEDDSPVTLADKEADKIIKDYLSRQFPKAAFLTEESTDTKERLENDFVFIVDPVDGTSEFVKRNGAFTTNIALSYKHEVVAGLINVPVEGIMYYASKGNGSYKQKRNEDPIQIHCSKRIEKNLRALISCTHYTEEEKESIERNMSRFESVEPVGAAIKFCLIAEGKADYSLRLSNGTKEWDTAAGDIIISEAGGFFGKRDLTRFTYNREDVYNREGFVLLNDKRNFFQ